MSGRARWSVLFSPPWGSCSIGGRRLGTVPSYYLQYRQYSSICCHRGGLWPVLSRAGGSLVGGGPLRLWAQHVLGFLALSLRGFLSLVPQWASPWTRAASSVRPCWFLLGFGMLGCISSVCSRLLCVLGVDWVLRQPVATSRNAVCTRTHTDATTQ